MNYIVLHLRRYFMIDKAVCNLLIPFSFEKDAWDRISNCKELPSKAQVEDIKKSKQYDSRIWFAYCFRELPINETFQMSGSPLICNNESALVKRIEITQPVRFLLGLHKNENRICTLVKEHIDFKIGKIRLLFFEFGLGMIHIETEGEALTTEKLLNFSEQLSAIQKDVEFSYENKVAKDQTEVIVTSIKQVINKLLSIQTYIHLGPYKKETFGKAYLQEYLVGDIPDSVRLQFFEMLRNQRRNNMKSATGVDTCYLYKPFEYISWIIGEKTLICYSDMSICGDDNRAFLTEHGGLVKSISLNYITIYTYLTMVQLLLREVEASKEQEMVRLLGKLPVTKLASEVHINELFDLYLNHNQWELSDRISAVQNELQSCLDDKFVSLSQQMNRMNKNISEKFSGLSEKTDYLVKQVDYIVSFTNTELRSFLDEERKKLKESGNIGEEAKVSKFIDYTSSYIDEKVSLSGDEIVKKEREGLQMLFADNWKYLMSTSQTSLVSAGTLLKRCADINTLDFDFSGICICATAALEAELKRVFFEGLLDYMMANYGNPEIDDANEIYKYWPDALLTVPKFQYARETNLILRKVKHFTMGNLPFLFGETGRLSDVPMIRTNQLEQAEMMKARMSEYLSTIVLDYYKATPYEAFYLENNREDCFTCQPGCFVWKCERIRENYRNKAAHVNVMSEKEASSCYQSIITKPDTYVYNAEIAGVILELFCKIDGSKLGKTSYGKTMNNKKPTTVTDVSSNSRQFSIGQIVELVGLEVTSKGVLRGMIVGSTVGASLSKKHLMENGIYAKQYLGRTISVKLVRWDENGQKYNAEWVGRR